MIKLASNAFLATKISFINEIANVSEEVGADVTEVARGMGLDERIGPRFLQAGAGYSGSCLPKDVSGLKQLAGNSGYHFQLLTAVIEVNELQKRRLIGKLQKHLGSLVGKRIALLGLAFKPDTDDMREAASLVLAGRLESEGAEVVAYDPVATARARELLPGVVMSVERARGTRWGRRRRARHRVAGVREARLGRRREGHEDAAARRRPELPRRRRGQGGRLHLRGGRPARRAHRRRERRRERALMQALILAGGQGTRLRPLTESVPKPVLPLAGRPHIAYVIDWLASHGVDDVVVSCGHLADGRARGARRESSTARRSASRSSPTRAAPRARSASPPTCSASASWC